jgi:hypothetical protein
VLTRSACASLCALVAACSADAVSIGADDAAFGSEPKPECRSDVSTSVATRNQQQIDALAGCEEIHGDLSITSFRGMDLRPLRWLRVVHGGFDVSSEYRRVPAESLAGLQALERVGGLALRNLEVSDLSALVSLTIVASDPINQNPLSDGVIIIDGCNQLRDLSGLAQVTGWSELMLSNNANLESLNGLYVGRELRRVGLLGLPKLRDLTALAPVWRIERLSIQNTGLEDLDGLEDVIYMGSLEIYRNPNLRSLQPLSMLNTLQDMYVSDNAVLEQLPQASFLIGLGRLMISNNPELRSVPRYHGGLGGLPARADGAPDTQGVGFQWIDIARNPKLSEIALPTNHASGQSVSVYDNQALTDLDLGGLRSVDSLEIRDNASLSQLTLNELARADDLTVVNNPQLSTGIFDNVQTFSRDMVGNLSGTGAAPAP